MSALFGFQTQSAKPLLMSQKTTFLGVEGLQNAQLVKKKVKKQTNHASHAQLFPLMRNPLVWEDFSKPWHLSYIYTKMIFLTYQCNKIVYVYL